MPDIPATFPLDVRVSYAEPSTDDVCAALNACRDAGAPNAANLLLHHIQHLEQQLERVENQNFERGLRS